MRIEIEPGVRLFVDIEGAALVPDGPVMREKPILLLLHGGPGWDHSGYKPRFAQLADLAQLVYLDLRGHGRSDPRPRAE
ncbi:MAG: alpha/beta fold hydrolase, partial [Pseudomonadota bacterium]